MGCFSRAFARFGLIAVLLTAGAPSIGAQVPANRAWYGALLEPVDGILHGAGQSPEAFRAYSDVMPAARRPMVYMHYIALKGLGAEWSSGLKAELERYAAQGAFVIPQIGLSMTTDGVPSSHYEGRVAAGAHDVEISNLVEGFRRLGYPAYLRIGYEFNGVSWNGYAPETYKAAYIRITRALRDAGLEVATVWCYAVDGATNYFDFYPGDPYVDWFGIDPFSAAHFTDATALSFMNNARARGKPVMIGETTPRGVGAQDPSDWADWFVPFFHFVDSQPGVKLFSYINWDWAEWAARLGTSWSHWGDARLETSPVVLANYIESIGRSPYLHAGPEESFRQRLGYADSTPPPAVGAISSVPGRTGAWIQWNPVADDSGIAHYLVYRDGERHDRTLKQPYEDEGARIGTATYEVAAVDRAGNTGPRSPASAIDITRIEHLENGEFDLGFAGWQLDSFHANAVASVTVDTDSRLSGPHSARIDITGSSGTDWHIQMRQPMTMTQGSTYTISFRATADRAVTFPVIFQKWESPYPIYFRKSVSIGTSPTTFSLSYSPDRTDVVAFTVFIGAVGTARIWFDDVSVHSGTGPVGVDPVPAQPRQGSPRASVFPNPVVDTGTAMLELTSPGSVTVEILDVLGRRVSSRRILFLSAGAHKLDLDTSGLGQGIHFVHVSGSRFDEFIPFVRLQ